MGINYAAQWLNKVSNVSISQLYTVGSELQYGDLSHSSSSVNAIHSKGAKQRPRVVLDANWLANKLNSYNQALNGIVTRVLTFSECLMSKGFEVYIVCDGKFREDSKRASIERVQQREKARIDSLYLRSELATLTDEMNNLGLNQIVESSELRERIDKLNKKVKKLDSDAFKKCGPNFASNLRRAVLAVKEQGGYHMDCLHFQEAVFQADPVLVKHCHEHQGTLVFASDSDISVLCGGITVMVSDFKFVESKNIIHSIVLSSAFIHPIQAVNDLIQNLQQEPSQKPIVFHKAKYKFFENRTLYERCVMAVALGCDTCPGGIAGEGCASLKRAMDKFDPRQPFIAQLFDWMIEKGTMGREAYKVFVDALYYEPASLVGDAESKWYVGCESPTRLPEYLANFLPDDQQPCAGPEMAQCKGRGDNQHSYLVAEGSKTCPGCSSIMCRLCVCKWETEVNGRKETELCCSECYSVRRCLGVTSEDDLKYENEMREALKEAKVTVKHGATLKELEEMVEEYVDHQAINFHDNDMSGIQFPKESSNKLDDESVFVPLLKIDFKEGGCFIRNPVLSRQHVMGIVSLIASLVDYGGKNSLEPGLKRYSVLPKTILEFASGCRVGSGQRLL